MVETTIAATFLMAWIVFGISVVAIHLFHHTTLDARIAPFVLSDLECRLDSTPPTFHHAT